jgi:hypothetical protein
LFLRLPLETVVGDTVRYSLGGGLFVCHKLTK